ncbi:MAG: tetratricopeptide repeat protein, partial [Gemmatimonadota bacterium]|nr:tetratricopeptide repeat protein [Gemmatimonadota bacterium]
MSLMTDPVDRYRISPLVWILLAALAIRLFYLMELASTPWFSHPIIDERFFDDWAQRIAHGSFISNEPLFRGPLYALFLAAVYAVFGHTYLVPRLLTVLLGTGSCFFMYYLGRKAFNRTTGLMAAMLGALYFPFIFFEGTLLIVGLFTFLNLVTLAALFRAGESLPGEDGDDTGPVRSCGRGWLWWGGAGVCAGLAAIARPNILLFLGFFFLWMAGTALHRRRTRFIILRHLTVFCAAMGLMIAPCTIHNYLVSHDFVLISSQAGINFFIGNNPRSTGIYTPLPGSFPLRGRYVDTAWLFARNQAEKETGLTLRPSQISQYWFNRGLRFWREEPGQAIKLLFKKFHMFWLGPEINNIMFVTFRRSRSRILKLVPFDFGLIGPLALLGLLAVPWSAGAEPDGKGVFGKRRLLLLFTVSYLLSVVPFFNSGRYRLPMVPVCIIFAAWALTEIVRHAKRKHWKQLLTIFLPLLILFSLAINIDPYGVTSDDPAKARWSLANAYQSQGEIGTAMDLYREVLQFDPGLTEAHLNLGNCYLQRDQFEHALRCYRKAMETDPGNATPYNNAAIASLGLKDRESAFSLVTRAWKCDPLNPFVH